MGEPVRAVLVLGSNVEKERNMPEAIRLLRRAPGIEVEAVSPIYESASVGGPPGAPDFFNAAVLIHTERSVADLRSIARAIEDELGRVRTDDPNAPRTIDVDIVYFGDRIEGGDRPLPAPDALTAPHVAVPIADVAPGLVHPVDGRATKQIAEQIDDGSVRPVMAIHLSSPYHAHRPEDFDDVGDVYAPRLEALVRQQLIELGEDPDRQGLEATPLRVAKALDYLTSGYSTSLEDIINDAIFDADGAEEMVVVKDIEFYSMCEHHMLPFFGNAAVAYLPDSKIIGLSKVARIVDVFSRRLQVQERLTGQIAEAMESLLNPHGVAVVLEGRHLCMMMRGVQKQESAMVTSAMRGTFKENPRTRAEFLSLVS
jgi:GTP cyclohydrolase IA